MGVGIGQVGRQGHSPLFLLYIHHLQQRHSTVGAAEPGKAHKQREAHLHTLHSLNRTVGTLCRLDQAHPAPALAKLWVSVCI